MQEQDSVSVTVLGPVTIDGAALTKRQQAIVAALVCFGDSGATTDRLIDAAWPGEVPRSARASLQNQVARLRTRFGVDTIETLPDGYRLVRPSDAARFEALVTEALSLACGQGAVGLLEAARDLWRGSPFECLCSHSEAQITRARLENLRADALDRLALCRIALGDLDTATAELSVLLLDDPYREQRWEMLMRSLHLGGRRLEALATFKRHEELMWQELGVTPSHSLRELDMFIRVSNGAEEPLLSGTSEHAA